MHLNLFILYTLTWQKQLSWECLASQTVQEMMKDHSYLRKALMMSCGWATDTFSHNVLLSPGHFKAILCLLIKLPRCRQPPWHQCHNLYLSEKDAQWHAQCVYVVWVCGCNMGCKLAKCCTYLNCHHSLSWDGFADSRDLQWSFDHPLQYNHGSPWTLE